MIVKELKEKLSTYPDDRPVLIGYDYDCKSVESSATKVISDGKYVIIAEPHY